MPKPKIYSHWRRPPLEKEHQSGEVIVDRAGYLSTRDRIEQMMLAGRTLVAARQQQFLYENESQDDGRLDPTMSKDYDIVDAVNELRDLGTKLEKSKKVQNPSPPPAAEPAPKEDSDEPSDT